MYYYGIQSDKIVKTLMIIKFQFPILRSLHLIYLMFHYTYQIYFIRSLQCQNFWQWSLIEYAPYIRCHSFLICWKILKFGITGIIPKIIFCLVSLRVENAFVFCGLENMGGNIWYIFLLFYKTILSLNLGI